MVEVPKGPDTIASPEPGFGTLFLAKTGPESPRGKVRTSFLFSLARELGDEVGVVSKNIPKEASGLQLMREGSSGILEDVVEVLAGGSCIGR